MIECPVGEASVEVIKEPTVSLRAAEDVATVSPNTWSESEDDASIDPTAGTHTPLYSLQKSEQRQRAKKFGWFSRFSTLLDGRSDEGQRLTLPSEKKFKARFSLWHEPSSSSGRGFMASPSSRQTTSSMRSGLIF